MSFRALLVSCLATLIAPLAVVAGPLEFESSAARVSLLELYTSEGCSSCPPADRFVNGLKSDRRLWREVVPVAFHVDYWDYIGWQDRFASPQYSERQRSYARSGYVKGVYTTRRDWCSAARSGGRGFTLRFSSSARAPTLDHYG
jgi:hypothetical protein